MFSTYQRFIRLEPGADPPAWSWPEIPRRDPPGRRPRRLEQGGPHRPFLQGEPELAASGSHFAFQFTAWWAGRELGDGAEYYAFIRDDGTAALTWDCH